MYYSCEGNEASGSLGFLDNYHQSSEDDILRACLGTLEEDPSSHLGEEELAEKAENSDGSSSECEHVDSVDAVAACRLTPVQECLVELDLVEAANGHILDSVTGEDLGIVRFMSLGDPYIQCTCRRHDRCNFLINARKQLNDKYIACLRFVRQGVSEDAASHRRAIGALKRSFGVQPHNRT